PVPGHQGAHTMLYRLGRALPDTERSFTPQIGKRRGASAVEFALVASIFFLLVFAIIEFGRVFMTLELLTEAARVGCRQGITPNATNAQIQQAATNFLTNVGIQGEIATVIINDGAGIQQAQNATSNSEITVRVTIPAANITWFPSFVSPATTLKGQWTLRRE